jgi:DNA-binding transcriptional regulator GbsR (MarR family)
MAFHEWPKRVTKESVKRVIEEHIALVNTLKTELRNVHKANKEAREELKRLRRQAADAYSDQRHPVEALQDIATSAKRERD